MARIAVDNLGQDPTPAVGHNLDLAMRVKALEDLAKGMANGDLLPGCQTALIFDVADHATQNIDQVIPVACTIIGAQVIKTSAPATAVANTVQVDNGVAGNHVTDAMSINNFAVGQVVRHASMFPAAVDFAVGATMRIIQTKAGGDAAFRIQLDVVLR